MAQELVGSLRFELIADTEKFERTMTASQKELRQTRQTMAQTEQPAERYGRRIEELNNLRKKAGKAAKSIGSTYGTLGQQLKTAATGIFAVLDRWIAYFTLDLAEKPLQSPMAIAI